MALAAYVGCFLMAFSLNQPSHPSFVVLTAMTAIAVFRRLAMNAEWELTMTQRSRRDVRDSET